MRRQLARRTTSRRTTATVVAGAIEDPAAPVADKAPAVAVVQDAEVDAALMGHPAATSPLPGGYKSIAQRKAETSCGHCGEAGHWWRECRIRLAEETKMEQGNAASSNQAAGPTAVPAAALASGNAPRQ
ncbi:hypothetical protein PF005_g25493 [Phytophthora fragariae]|uniref:CCHC-type domain-containing protein n=2 Tax=Phytophthora fragariae TaxID=53985 RepID=A0A6A3W278_9STRA|nr:hypothetical protein PF005_g25493 [Phytophthora fragariae]